MAGLQPASLGLQGKLRQTARQEAGKKKRGQQKPRRPKMESGMVLHCNCCYTMLLYGSGQCHSCCASANEALHTGCNPAAIDVQGRTRLSRGFCCPLQGPAQSKMPNHPVRSARMMNCSYGLMAVRLQTKCFTHAAFCTLRNPAHALRAAGPAR